MGVLEQSAEGCLNEDLASASSSSERSGPSNPSMLQGAIKAPQGSDGSASENPRNEHAGKENHQNQPSVGQIFRRDSDQAYTGSSDKPSVGSFNLIVSRRRCKQLFGFTVV